MVKATHVYIGRRSCGCATVVVVDAPDYAKFTAREVADMIRRGYQVERVKNDKVGALVHECPHDESTPRRKARRKDAVRTRTLYAEAMKRKEPSRG